MAEGPNPGPISRNLYKQNVVKLFLNNAASRAPIKKSDIITHALHKNGKIFKEVLDAARQDLLEIYGIKVIEEKKSVQQYITISALPAVSADEYTLKQQSEITLLFLILSFIFMKGGTINEDNLFTYLKKLQINPDETHNYFGADLRKRITETFVKQSYLIKEKVVQEGTINESIVYSWGRRSELEFPKKDVLNIVVKLLGKSPTYFAAQYAEANSENINN